MKKRIGPATVFASIAACAAPAALHAGPVVYVDQNATGPAFNGTTWCSAYLDLSDALQSATPGSTIKVANGVYKPNTTGLPNPRDATFVMLSGVRVEGGYAGCGAPNPDARNTVLYETVLSGDLNGNDTPNFGNRGDNAYHVIVTHDVNATAVLDGLTIRGGYADGPNFGPSTASKDQGSGVNNYHGTPHIENCVFEDNHADNHGTLNDHGNAVLIDCTFRNNHSGIVAGGLYMHFDAATSVTDCQFIDNRCDGKGGGAYHKGTTTSTFTNCLFSGNDAANGGGMYCDNGSTPTLIDCTFTENGTLLIGPMAGLGGGMYNLNSHPTLMGCTFSENSAIVYAGAMFNEGSNPVLIDCDFTDNTSDLIGAGVLSALDSEPLFINCDFTGNVAQVGGALLNDTFGNPILIGCRFENNMAAGGTGGAGYNVNWSAPVYINSVFIQNSATFGGVTANSSSAVPTFFNCLFLGNSASVSGGAISSFANANPSLINCTFSANTADNFGGAVFVRSDSAAQVDNSVLWGNTASGVANEAGQLYDEGSGLTVNTSLVQGWTGALGGVGNVGANPLFVDADGPDGILGNADDNVRLGTGSPAIDAGNNAVIISDVGDLDDDDDTDEPTPLDYDDVPRVQNGIVDIGAFESIADCNLNGMADWLELQQGVADDCNANAVPDECDIDSGASPDCDDNAAPDECQPDGDGDGAIDACDGCPNDGDKTEPGVCGCGVADADSDGDGVLDCEDLCPGFDDALDADQDGVPDACDQCPGFDDTVDCNLNDYPDACEILDGQVDDLDGNGIPDDCDIAPAVSDEGCRAFYVTPLAGTGDLALQVLSPDYACLSRYVGLDGYLTDAPVYQAPEEWGTVTIRGAELVPLTTYDVTSLFAEGSPSAPVRVTMWKWGDVDHDFDVDFADIFLVVKGFQGDFTNATLAASDLVPCTPDGVVDFLDIAADVRAFQAQQYAATGCPGPCP